MSDAVELAQVWRGPFLESRHFGHAVICGADGEIVEAWGDPSLVVLPRSSAKMVQALPLVESGAAAAFGVKKKQLALACASHQGADIHTRRVERWLGKLGFGDDDLNCGPQAPRDEADLRDMYLDKAKPCRVHNNCSGKHAGFLTLSKHLGAERDARYVDPAHPVQVAVKAAFEEVMGENSPGYGIDGCSAPNFACSLHGMARAMAFFASADGGEDLRSKAAVRLRQAMVTYPELVAGEGRACTELMRAMDGHVALKTGAEAFFVAIIPEKKLGVALKVLDGSTRGAECAISAILVRLGLLNPKHPAAVKRLHGPIRNFASEVTGEMRPGAAFA